MHLLSKSSPRFAPTLACAAVALLLATSCEDRPLTDLGAAPSFTLTDQAGAPFESSSLAGRVWIASFVYTSCDRVCPMLTGQLRNLQRRLSARAERVAFVSFTTDPETDTPQKLAEYAQLHGADAANWWFLAGDSAAQQGAIARHYYAWAGQTPPEGLEGSLHATHLLLVDERGHMRGFYAYDATGLDELEEAVNELLSPGRR